LAGLEEEFDREAEEEDEAPVDEESSVEEVGEERMWLCREADMEGALDEAEAAVLECRKGGAV